MHGEKRIQAWKCTEYTGCKHELNNQLSICHKPCFYNPYIFVTIWSRLYIFQTINYVKSNNLSLNYQRFWQDMADINFYWNYWNVQCTGNFRECIRLQITYKELVFIIFYNETCVTKVWLVIFLFMMIRINCINKQYLSCSQLSGLQKSLTKLTDVFRIFCFWNCKFLLLLKVENEFLSTLLKQGGRLRLMVQLLGIGMMMRFHHIYLLVNYDLHFRSMFLNNAFDL